MSENATPRRQPGTRQGALDRTQLIAATVPYAGLAADYSALAALLHAPNLAAPHLSHLDPGDWTRDVHRIVARIALAHLRAIGRVDHRQLVGVLLDARIVPAEALRLELAILARVAELINDGSVARAVAVLTAHHREAAA